MRSTRTVDRLAAPVFARVLVLALATLCLVAAPAHAQVPAVQSPPVAAPDDDTPSGTDPLPGPPPAPPRTAAPAPAPSTDAGPGTDAALPLVDVVLEPRLDGEDPWARVGLRPGTLLGPAVARAALRTALTSGTFAEARASTRAVPGGVVLVLRGERRVRVQEVAFSGVQARALDTVRTDFGIANGAWVTDADRARAVERLEASYRNAGWESAAVVSRWRVTDDPATRVLIVNVTEGAATVVRRITFAGLPRDVTEAVREAAGLAPGDVAAPQAARRVFDSVATALRGAGYLSAAVQQVRFVPTARARVDALVTVRAGPLYRIEWVGITWFARGDLEPALRLEEEHGLEATTLSVLVGRVRDFYVRRGFLDVRVRAEVQPVSPTAAVLRFTVRQGAQVLVRATTFPGAVHIRPDALRDVLHEVLTAELPGTEFLAEPGPAVEAALDGGAGFTARPPPPPRVRLAPERTFVPELYADAARRMVVRYHEQGFLNAAVAAPDVTRAADDRGRPVLDVAFRVTEGPRTVFDELVFEGNDSVASAVLVAQTDLRLGVALSFATIDRARVAIEEYYREQGHLFVSVRVDPARGLSPDHTRARVYFEIHEGPAVRVGRVTVRGNASTRRGIIVERVALRPGELYRPSLVRTTQRQLSELGIFTGVTVTPIDPDVEAPVKDVVVQVVEVLPNDLLLRAGFSTGEGLRAGLEYSYRNIAGTGITAALGIQLGYQVFIAPNDQVYADNFNALPVGDRLRRRLTLSLLFPVIPAFGPYWRATLDIVNSRIIEREFAIDTTGVSASVIFRPARWFSATATQEIQDNGLQLLGAQNIDSILQDAASSDPGDVERLRRLLLLPAGTTTLFATRLTASIDLRDQVFNPQRGVYITATAEYVQTLDFEPSTGPTAGPTGDPPGNTLRGLASVSGYIPLPFGGVVLATNLRGGININVGPPNTVTYTNRQFFLGGADSLRGWLQDSLLPADAIPGIVHDVSACTNQALWSSANMAHNCPALVSATQRGGDAFVLWRNEVRIPLGATGFALGLFLDVGNLWKNPAAVDLLDLRADAGAGVRYLTPIGPVAFDYGFNLSPRTFLPNVPNDDRFREAIGNFNFSIGLF